MNIYIIGGVTFVIILIHYMYYRFTKFNKNIIVMKKYKVDMNGSTTMCIIDEYNTKYVIGSCIWKFNWEPIDNWNKMIEGSMYKVDGYGKKIDQFGVYPIIHNIFL